MSTGGGVSVGALIVPKRRAQAVIECLDGCLWRKTRVKPTPHDANTLAIALNPAGARVLDSRLLCGKRQCGEGGTASVEIPAELSKLLDDGEVTWASGLRVGAAAAESPSGAARSVRPPATATFLYAELFAGIGGFRLGLEALGGHCVFASEIDPFAAATYARNFGETPLGDITEIRTESIPAHDVLTAGFPCQSFSRAGAQKGLEDQRGDLFHEIIRVANAQQPRALILENVPNLIHIDRGHALHYIISELCGAGYHVRVQVLNAAALVPQHRERLFLVCFRDAKAADAFRWPYFPSERPPPPPTPLICARSIRPLAAVRLPAHREPVDAGAPLARLYQGPTVATRAAPGRRAHATELLQEERGQNHRVCPPRPARASGRRRGRRGSSGG